MRDGPAASSWRSACQRRRSSSLRSSRHQSGGVRFARHRFQIVHQVCLRADLEKLFAEAFPGGERHVGAFGNQSLVESPEHVTYRRIVETNGGKRLVKRGVLNPLRGRCGGAFKVWPAMKADAVAALRALGEEQLQIEGARRQADNTAGHEDFHAANKFLFEPPGLVLRAESDDVDGQFVKIERRRGVAAPENLLEQQIKPPASGVQVAVRIEIESQCTGSRLAELEEDRVPSEAPGTRRVLVDGKAVAEEAKPDVAVFAADGIVEAVVAVGDGRKAADGRAEQSIVLPTAVVADGGNAAEMPETVVWRGIEVGARL